ncbi:tetratricopeptide (TPR) repeat protein [Sinorhizobium fredii]|nr:TPR repeat [Sinorhizobium fredii CCBAU 25509]
MREDAAYGQSLAYLRAGLTSKAAVAATKSPQSRARVAAILADRAIAAFDAGRYRETLIFLDQLRRISGERTDLMVLRGYAYLRLNRFAEAKRIFAAAAATGNRDAGEVVQTSAGRKRSGRTSSKRRLLSRCP